jgi:ribosome maturation protein SDO1
LAIAIACSMGVPWEYIPWNALKFLPTTRRYQMAPVWPFGTMVLVPPPWYCNAVVVLFFFLSPTLVRKRHGGIGGQPHRSSLLFFFFRSLPSPPAPPPPRLQHQEMPYQKGPQKADLTPQIRHTNIAVVRLKAKKEKFEIACYRNKVINWRGGVETDLDEVLQMATVFTSVTSGVRATKKSLTRAFGTDDQLACCRVILDKGELQVSDKEREHAFKLLFNEVAQTVAAMCFNPKSQRPYTVSLIKDAMIKHQFHLNTGKTAKKQALDCVRFLSQRMDLERMKMLIAITVPAALWVAGSPLRAAVAEHVLETRSMTQQGRDVVVHAVINAGSFRDMSASVQDALAGTSGPRASVALLGALVEPPTFLAISRPPASALRATSWGDGCLK